VFSAAIFDMDGLLLDSERTIMNAWVSAAAEAGITVTAADYAPVIGLAGPGTKAHLARIFGGESMVQQIHALVTPKLTSFPVKAGAAALLAKLTALGLPRAVASSTSIKEVRRRLEVAELAHYFDAITGGDEVPAPKPDPAVYLLAAQRLEIAPEHCLALDILFKLRYLPFRSSWHISPGKPISAAWSRSTIMDCCGKTKSIKLPCRNLKFNL